MKAVKAAVVACVALLALAGCKDTGESYKQFQTRSERPEYDCMKHAKDGICEIPWKGKVVLYCVKGKVHRVVRFREECT